MSMFKTLAPFANGAAVHLSIFNAGEGRLRAIISQKLEGKAADDQKPLSLAVTGTPEELDTELPLALAESIAAPVKSVADQVKEQQAASASDDSEGATETRIAKATAKKVSGKASAKKPVKTPVKTKAETPVKKTDPAPAPDAPVIAPMYPAKAKAAAPKSEPKADSKETKRAACLADLNDALAKHGDNLTRRTFTAEAKTGRSFETAFGSWEKFLDARAAAHNQQAVEAQQSTQTAAVQVAGTEDPASVQSTPAAVPVAEQVSDPVDITTPETGTKSSATRDLLGPAPTPATTRPLQIF